MHSFSQVSDLCFLPQALPSQTYYMVLKDSALVATSQKYLLWLLFQQLLDTKAGHSCAFTTLANTLRYSINTVRRLPLLNVLLEFFLALWHTYKPCLSGSQDLKFMFLVYPLYPTLSHPLSLNKERAGDLLTMLIQYPAQ